MALAGVCGFNMHDDFSRNREPNEFSDASEYCRNISNNLELALPPFANVSIFYFLKIH